MSETIKRILRQLKNGRISEDEAFRLLGNFPYDDIGFCKVDSQRSMRRGFPEVIYGEGKTVAQIERIAHRILAHDGILLITRADKGVYARLKKRFPKILYNNKARVIYYHKRKPEMKKGTVLVVTAGTADMPVAEEAAVTLKLMGNKVEILCDVGVAGLHRVLDKRDALTKANVIIVIAGMEGALASVVSGLVSKPVIAVPTSVGYGASFKGLAALLAMMNSCSPGVSVVNIDNGFGAGYFASLINT